MTAPKPEVRIPEIRIKSEITNPNGEVPLGNIVLAFLSDFGFRSLIRISGIRFSDFSSGLYSGNSTDTNFVNPPTSVSISSGSDKLARSITP